MPTMKRINIEIRLMEISEELNKPTTDSKRKHLEDEALELDMQLQKLLMTTCIRFL